MSQKSHFDKIVEDIIRLKTDLCICHTNVKIEIHVDKTTKRYLDFESYKKRYHEKGPDENVITDNGIEFISGVKIEELGG